MSSKQNKYKVKQIHIHKKKKQKIKLRSRKRPKKARKSIHKKSSEISTLINDLREKLKN